MPVAFFGPPPIAVPPRPNPLPGPQPARLAVLLARADRLLHHAVSPLPVTAVNLAGLAWLAPGSSTQAVLGGAFVSGGAMLVTFAAHAREDYEHWVARSIAICTTAGSLALVANGHPATINSALLAPARQSHTISGEPSPYRPPGIGQPTSWPILAR